MAYCTFYHFHKIDSTTAYCMRNYALLSSFSVVSVTYQEKDKKPLYVDENALICSLLKKDITMDKLKLEEIASEAMIQTGKEIGVNLTYDQRGSFYIYDKKMGEMELFIQTMYVIVTYYLNVNTIHFKEDMKNKAISLKLILNRDSDQTMIKEKLAHQFYEILQKKME